MRIDEFGMCKLYQNIKALRFCLIRLIAAFWCLLCLNSVSFGYDKYTEIRNRDVRFYIGLALDVGGEIVHANAGIGSKGNNWGVGGNLSVGVEMFANRFYSAIELFSSLGWFTTDSVPLVVSGNNAGFLPSVGLDFKFGYAFGKYRGMRLYTMIGVETFMYATTIHGTIDGSLASLAFPSGFIGVDPGIGFRLSVHPLVDLVFELRAVISVYEFSTISRNDIFNLDSGGGFPAQPTVLRSNVGVAVRF